MSGLPWRGPGPGRPDLPLPPAARPAAPKRLVAKALALPRRVLRGAAALRGPRPGRAGRADLLGALGARRRGPPPRADADDRPARPRRGLDRGRGGRERGPDRLGARARRDGGPGRGAGPRRGAAYARSCARAPGRGRSRSARAARATTTSGPASARSRSSATSGSASGGSARAPAGSRTRAAATTRTTRSGAGRRASASPPTAARSPGTWSAGSTTPPSAPSARLGRRRAHRARPGQLRRPRGDRPRRRAARVLGRVRPREGREARLRRVQLPAAVRDVLRASSRAASSSSAASASWSTTTPAGKRRKNSRHEQLAPRPRLRLRACAVALQRRSMCQRQGGSSPGGKSKWLAPARVSSGTITGTCVVE